MSHVTTDRGLGDGHQEPLTPELSSQSRTEDEQGRPERIVINATAAEMANMGQLIRKASSRMSA